MEAAPVMNALRIAVVLAAVAVAAFAAPSAAWTPLSVVGSVEHTFQFTGGLPNCTNCGEPTLYACSPSLSTGAPIGNWNSGKLAFNDSVPDGMVALEVGLALHGSWDCDTTASFTEVALHLQGHQYNTIFPPSSQQSCACGVCGVELNFCGRNQLGLADYAHGGVNVAEVFVPSNSSSICVTSAKLTIRYGKAAVVDPDTERLVVGVPFANNSQYESEGYQINFADPFPKGYIVISAELIFYGWACLNYSGNFDPHDYATLSFGMQDLAIGGDVQGIETGCDVGLFGPQPMGTDNYCTSHVLKSIRYQSGWPRYVYGGENYVNGFMTTSQEDGSSYAWSPTRFELLLTAYKP